MRWFIRDLMQAPITGWWLMVADILWGFSFDHRESYYQYKQDCWRNAVDAQTFAGWVRNGGWRL